ncbi:MAG: VOC family protein [Pseudomonadota bacterium]|nr:VOC family protein [Pseudomonadota bacterium]
MFSHVTLGVADFDRAYAYYAPLCGLLGLEQSFKGTLLNSLWAGWRTPGVARPLFAITEPFEGEFAPGNGNMVAFLAESREQVDRFHALALRLGGKDEGAPALRPQYHENYYGAYLRDTEGNKIAIACHDAP